jgi:phosphoribosyl 1,2-cyclic phosphodiesterase
VTFYGVRGSCPCSGDEISRYGGATSCVAVWSDVAGEPPFVLDLGTGARRLGEELHASRAEGDPLPITAVTTHLHFDHIQGLPFFAPALREGTVLDVHGPTPPGGTLAEAFAHILRPPYFPLPLAQLPADIRFHELDDGELAVGSLRVLARRVPHVGPTCGYRVETAGASVAYVSDHQAPRALDSVDPAVVELCAGADLLIHDAQYTEEEFRRKAHWGHSTVGYAVRVAAEAGVRRLALFHHDPTHDDDQLDRLGEEASRAGGVTQVVIAAEGLTLEVGA